MSYQFEHSWERERNRLAAMQQGGDPFTIDILTSIGVDKGWRCLEIGAGAGSLTRWLCDRVGLDGSVVATDLETGFLSEIAAPNLEVRRHDIRSDLLEVAGFDLVFARKVLEHLPDYASALRKMVAAARPGGWVLIEDPDLSVFGVVGPDSALASRAYRAFVDTMADWGYQPELGPRLGPLLLDAGLTQIQVRARGSEYKGTRGSVLALTFEKIRDRIVESNRLDAEQADWFLSRIQSPSFRAITGIHFAAWGRKPRAEGAT